MQQVIRPATQADASTITELSYQLGHTHPDMLHFFVQTKQILSAINTSTGDICEKLIRTVKKLSRLIG